MIDGSHEIWWSVFSRFGVDSICIKERAYGTEFGKNWLGFRSKLLLNWRRMMNVGS